MPNEYPNASLIRRGAAIVYDALLILAFMMLASLPLSALDPGNGGLGFISNPWLHFVYQLFLYYLIFVFYYVFWRIKGQTLGMQVWKIKAVDISGHIMSPRQCVIRFAVATPAFALALTGFLWALFDKERLTVYDRISNSRVVYLGTRPYASESKSTAGEKQKE